MKHDRKERKISAITFGIILSIIILNVTDGLLTFYCFSFGTGIEERNFLLSSRIDKINVKNLIGSTIYSLVLVIFILLFGLWKYKAVRIFLYLWVASEVAVIALGIYSAIIILTPYPY